MSIRVCFVISPYYPPRFGGGGHFPVKLSEALLKYPEIKITHITSRPGHLTPHFESHDRLNIYRLPALNYGGQRGEVYSYAISNSMFVSLKQSSFNLIHIFGAFPYALGCLLIAHMAKMKSIVRMTEMWADDPHSINTRLFGPLQNKIFFAADRIVSVSDELSQAYLDFGFSPDKLVEIINGVDHIKFTPVSSSLKTNLRRTLKLPPNRSIGIFVGSIIHRKGVDLLIEAWGRLKEKLNDAIPMLLLLGPTDIPALPNNEVFIKSIQSRIIELSLEQDVRFVGQVSNVENYLQAADFFTFPSRSEGMPSALLEAMSCGLPSIASIGSGAKRVIRNSYNGYLIDDDDIDSLVILIEKLNNSPSHRKDLGVAARRTILKSATLELCAEKHISLYKTLLDR